MFFVFDCDGFYADKVPRYRYHPLVQTAGLGRANNTGHWEEGTRASVYTRVGVVTGDHVPVWGRVLTIVPVSTSHWSPTHNQTICPV